jgi:hypothetical protein
MTITKTKIELNFKQDYDRNEYYHGKDFQNPNLKYLTPKKLSEIIKNIAVFNSESRNVPIENFSDSVDLDYEITKEEIENPTQELVPLYLKFISGVLAYDTYPSAGLTITSLPKVASMLTKDELIELLNHLAYPYFEYGDYWVGLVKLYVIETDLGSYFKWEVMHGDGDYENKDITPFTTLDQQIDFTKLGTVKELKEFLNTLHEDNKLPKLTYKYKEN